MFTDKSKETACLKASLRGNTQAFEGLVRQYQSLVCAITYSATGNVVQSEELAQDVFLKAWKNLHQLQDVGKFRSWLCRIAQTTVQNWFRSQRRDTTAQAAPLEAAIDTPSKEPGPVEVTVRQEHEALVTQALSQLPASQRTVLVLFYREQQSVREVARQLAISEAAARQRISRARKMIRDQVQSVVEETLAHTRPAKAFTTAVIASVTALAVPSALTQAAAAQATATAGGQVVVTGLFSSAVAKACCVAGALVIIAGGVAAFKRSQFPGVGQELSTAFQSMPGQSVQVESEPPLAAPAAPLADQQARVAPIVQGSTDAPIPKTVTPTVAPGQATPKPHVFTPQGVLSGLITDSETGAPIAGAQVRISGTSRGFEAHTNANGLYSFEVIPALGQYSVFLAAYPDYVSSPWPGGGATLQLDPTQQLVKHFELDRACQVAVTVIDANGTAIAGAKVIATSLAGPSHEIVADMGDLPYDRQTDPNGFLLYGGFPPAEIDYLITVYHQREITTTINGQDVISGIMDHAPARALVHLTDPNEITSIAVTLEKGQDVHGYIEYADGTPGADIKLSAYPSWWHCNRGVGGYLVKEDGTFALKHIIPGDYDIRVTYPGTTQIRPLLKTTLPPVDEEALVVILPDKSAQSLASISGVLQILGGETPDYMEINALNLMTHKQETVMLSKRPDGNFPDTFAINRLEPGSYDLRFFAGPKFEDKFINDVEAPCSDLFVEVKYLNMAQPKLTGTVLDLKTEQPIDQFKLRILHVSRSNYSTGRHQWIEFSNQQGNFQWEVKKPGVYRVQVAAHGYAPVWSHEINTDNSEPVVIHLSPGGTLAGTVVDESGKRLDGAKVIPLSLACGATPKTQTVFVSEEGAVDTTEGSFILKHLPPGRETVRVTYPGHAISFIDQIEIAEGRATQGLEIVVRSGGIIEGIVYDDEGYAQANQVLKVRIGNQFLDFLGEPLATVITDSNGFYRVEHMPNELCRLHRAVPWNTTSGVMIQSLIPENGKIHSLDFGGTPLVRGSVILDDVPIAEHRLVLGSSMDTHTSEFMCFTQTDEHGGFVFRGVRPGAYTIYCENPNREQDQIRITTIEMGTVDLDLGLITSTAAKP